MLAGARPAAGTVAQAQAATATPGAERVAARRFDLCDTGPRRNCVVDGDTFWLASEKIRIADIDTPETHTPRCAREGELGEQAARRLQQLLNGGPFMLEPAANGRPHDRYGRRLAIVTRQGVNLGGMLASEGLARPYTGGRRAPWC